MSDKTITAIEGKVRTLADELKTVGEIDVTTGHIKFAGAEDVFVKHLREGLSLDMVKQVQEELLDYTAAQTLAVGELSNPSMQSHADLKRTSSKETIGFARIETVYDRQRSGTAMGKPWVKRGVADTDLVLGVGRKTTQYKDVVAYLGHEADNVFGG